MTRQSIRRLWCALLVVLSLPLMAAQLLAAENPTARAAYDRAKAAITDKKYDDAISALDEAIKADPQWSDAYYERAWVYNEIRQSDKAIPDLNRALEIDPQWGRAYAERGWAYKELGKYNSALADFNKAISLDQKRERFPRPRLDYNSSASTIWRSPISTRPSRSIRTTPINSASVVEHVDQPNTAVSDCTEALKIEPNSAGALQSRGDAYFSLKDWDSAIADYKAALAIAPDDETIKKSLESAEAAKSGAN